MLIAVGLVRNAGDVVDRNVRALYATLDKVCGDAFRLVIYENDSTDNTAIRLEELSLALPKLKVISERGIDARHPERIGRLAHCRERLLAEARSIDAATSCTHYVVVDLDSRIAESLRPAQLAAAIRKLDAEGLDGVFPVSSPVYYDIAALRAAPWCGGDCVIERVRDLPRYGAYGSVLVHVVSKQLAIEEFPVGKLIPVESAFGGVGVYRFAGVRDKTYLGHDYTTSPFCEHVVFHSQLGKLAIDTDFVVDAPNEHISLRMATAWQLWRQRLRSAAGDVFRSLTRLFRGITAAVAVACTGTASVDYVHAAPVIFWSAEPVLPGESALLLGSGFSERMMVGVRAAEESRPRGVAELAASESTVCFVVPRDLPAGVVTCKLSTAEGDLDFRLNMPQPWWIQADNGQSGSPGGWIRIFGRCLAFPESRPQIQLRNDATSVDLQVVEASPWNVTGRLAADTAGGPWRVWIYNGTGGPDAWTDAGSITVGSSAPSASRKVQPGDAFGAISDDNQDDTAAIQNAIDAAAKRGGGVVSLARGRFRLSGQLDVPSNVTLRGTGMAATHLAWADADEPPRALIATGGENVAIEDLGIYAHNYFKGISVRPNRLRDGTVGPRPHNVRIRRVCMRLTPFSLKGLTDQQKQARRAAAGNKAVLEMFGDNMRLLECDFAWPTHIGFTMQGNDLLCRNNVARADNGGWCPVGGGERAIIEGNHFSGVTTGITRGGKVWFANNVIEHQYEGFREGFTTDGTFGGPGFLKSPRLDGDWIAFKTDHDRSEPEGIPAAVRIVEGKGAGQTRMVRAFEGSRLQIERPFDIQPDDSSLLWAANVLRHHIVYRNTVSDTGIAVQLFGGALDCIVAENQSARSGGYRSSGEDMCWHVQFLGNRITEGLGTIGPEYQGGQSFVGAIGPWVRDFKGATSRGIVMRGNLLENNASLHLRAGVDGVLLEGNSVSHSRHGIYAEIPAWQRNVYCRGNRFENVDEPFSPADLRERYRLLPSLGR